MEMALRGFRRSWETTPQHFVARHVRVTRRIVELRVLQRGRRHLGELFAESAPLLVERTCGPGAYERERAARLAGDEWKHEDRGGADRSPMRGGVGIGTALEPVVVDRLDQLRAARGESRRRSVTESPA